MAGPLKLTRDQLASFLKDPQQIRQFEKLFGIVDAEVGTSSVTDANTLAGNAYARAQAAFDGLVALGRIMAQLDSAPSVEASATPTPDYADFANRRGNPAWREGRLFYDQNDHALSYYTDNPHLTLNIGKELVFRACNNSGAAMTDGQVVYVNGAVSGTPTIALAQATTAALSQGTIGIVTTQIDDGEYGYVTVFGAVGSIDTSAWANGAALYLSAATPGGITDIAPVQPNYDVLVGYVMNSAVDGRVMATIHKRGWFPSLVLLETGSGIVLPATPTVFKPSTIGYNDGFSYSAGTGEITFLTSGSYNLSGTINATPSAANKHIYLYAEENTGSGWQIVRYSARDIELENGTEEQVNISSARYYKAGDKLRLSIYGDATVTLNSTDLPGTTPGTVTLAAFRLMIA